VKGVALGDIADFIMGQAPPGASCNEDGNGTPFVKAGEFGDQRPIIREWTTRPLQFAKATDVLVCVVGATAGKLNLGADCAIGRSVGAVRPRPGRLDQMFAYHFLQTQTLKLRGGSQGSAQGVITRGMLENLQVPDMSLAEQRRIADILDKADAIRRKRKEAIALTEELLRSAFLEMFGDPVSNPKGWPVKPLGEVIDHLDAGWSANGDARERMADEFGVLKVSAVTSGIFRAEEHKAVPASAIDRELVTPRRGDLLFSRANTRELVAATCLVERDEPRLFLPDKLWRVVPRASVATAPYLRFLLAHDRLRAELTKTATGTSGSMLNVSMDKLRGLRAPFPPIDLQNNFVLLVWRSLSAKARHQSAHEQAEDLFNSLVARAFSGALEKAR